MATKIFCDNPVCNKEFAPTELWGKLMYLTSFYTKVMQKQIKQNELIFCENCTKDVLKIIDEKIVDNYKIDKKE